MSLTQVFPTLQTLEAAHLHDVAAVVLNYANAQQNERFHRSNLTGLADEYANDPSVTLPPNQRRGRARRIVAEAVAYLFNQGFLADDGEPGMSASHMVTRLGRTIKTRQDFTSYAQAALLPRALLREELAEIVMPLFLAGHYDDAVGAAFKRLEITVRKAGNFPDDAYGVPLMRDAFGEGGPLAETSTVKSEREAFAHLFAGALGYFKNPLSHRDLGIDDARMAASRILFANELLALVHLRVAEKEESERAQAS